MNKVIQHDLFRYDQQTSIIKGFRKPGFAFTYFFRKSKLHQKKSIKGIIYRIVIRYLSYKFGFQIPVNTSIGKGLYIGHFGTIVINEKAILGENCNIAHNTTIGRASRGELKGSPVIGDHVWIGTGAVIVGNIQIGSNVLIAPNSYLNFDVPDDSIVIGNPAKIVSKVNATSGYINNILN